MASVRDCVIDAIWGHQHRTRSSLLQSLRCLARPLQDAPRVCRAPCLARPLGARLGLQPTDVGLTSHRARASDSIQRGSAVWARPLGTRFGLQPTRWSCLARALGARLGLHPSRWAVWRFPGARLKLNPTNVVPAWGIAMVRRDGLLLQRTGRIAPECGPHRHHLPGRRAQIDCYCPSTSGSCAHVSRWCEPGSRTRTFWSSVRAHRAIADPASHTGLHMREFRP